MPKPLPFFQKPTAYVYAGHTIPASGMMIEPRSERGLVPKPEFGYLDAPYEAYLESLDPHGDSDGSKSLRHMLAISEDVRFQAFLARLSDPVNRNESLAVLAKRAGISLPDFASFWQKAQHQRALAVAQNALPALTGDIVQDARSKHVLCSACDGLGWIEANESTPPEVKGYRALGDKFVRTCPVCDGEGRVISSGDAEARRMLLEMTGLSGRKSGTSVQIQQNFNGMGMSGAVSRLNQISYDLNE